MINLLPPDVKQSYGYARRNVALRRWVVLFLIALVGLGGIGTYGVLSIHQSTKQYQKQLADSEKLFQSQNLSGVQKQSQSMSNDFKLVIKVLGKEVLFSELLKQIAVTMPANTNLTGLTINEVHGGLDITAVASDYDTATQVQVNLSDPANKIFTKADIVTIDCSGANSTDKRYPCSIAIRALFAAKNPFLFINSKATP